MIKYSKSFFTDKEVIFIGYSTMELAFSNSVCKIFGDHGIKVYPINNEENATFDFKVYKSVSDLPVVPKIAMVTTNSVNSAIAAKELIEKGVKKILFFSKKTVDEATLKACSDAGVETALGCPLMAYGGGIHKFHAFLAGVK